MLYLHYLWCHMSNFDSVWVCQQEEAWQKQNSKQTNPETQAVPLRETLVKPNRSVAKEHQGTPLFSRSAVSSHKGPILLTFGCDTGGLWESMVCFNWKRSLTTAEWTSRCPRSHTHIPEILYKHVCCLTLITRFTASPKTLLFCV